MQWGSTGGPLKSFALPKSAQGHPLSKSTTIAPHSRSKDIISTTPFYTAGYNWQCSAIPTQHQPTAGSSTSLESNQAKRVVKATNLNNTVAREEEGEGEEEGASAPSSSLIMRRRRKRRMVGGKVVLVVRMHIDFIFLHHT